MTRTVPPPARLDPALLAVRSAVQARLIADGGHEGACCAALLMRLSADELVILAELEAAHPVPRQLQLELVVAA